MRRRRLFRIVHAREEEFTRNLQGARWFIARCDQHTVTLAGGVENGGCLKRTPLSWRLLTQPGQPCRPDPYLREGRERGRECMCVRECVREILQERIWGSCVVGSLPCNTSVISHMALMVDT